MISNIVYDSIAAFLLSANLHPQSWHLIHNLQSLISHQNSALSAYDTCVTIWKIFIYLHVCVVATVYTDLPFLVAVDTGVGSSNHAAINFGHLVL